jgi:hypothetical protein
MEPVATLHIELDRLALTDNAAYIVLPRSRNRTVSPDGKKWKQAVIDKTTATIKRTHFDLGAIKDCVMFIRVHQVMPLISFKKRDAHNGGKLLIDGVCSVIGLDDKYAISTTLSKELGAEARTIINIDFYPRESYGWPLVKPTTQSQPRRLQSSPRSQP